MLDRKFFVVIVVVLSFGFLGCGGGGGGGDERGAWTVFGTIPLNINDRASISGTYQVTHWKLNGPGGLSFDSNQLDSFSFRYVINYTQNYADYKIEYQDAFLGDYYDHNCVYADDLKDTIVDDVYYQINSKYQITFFVKNMYVPGKGISNQVFIMTKTSDSTAPNPLKRDVEKTPDNSMFPINPGLIVLALQQ